MGAAVYLGNTLAIRALLGCNTSSVASVDNSLLEAGVIDRMKQYVVNSKRIKMKEVLWLCIWWSTLLNVVM